MTIQAGPTVRIVGATLAVLIAVFAVSPSAQPRRRGDGITVYTNPDFGGDAVTFNHDTPDLREYSLNDKISSLEIPNGESWEVCQDIDYGNRCTVFSGAVANLRSTGWNDRISSLRRVGAGRDGRRRGADFRPDRSQRLVLYDRHNFRGSTTVMTSEMRRGLGNRIGSAEVQGGPWQLCDRTGHCAMVYRDIPDLSQLGLTGRITSARPVRGSVGGNDRNRYYNHGRR